jgi:hypothetical protein
VFVAISSLFLFSCSEGQSSKKTDEDVGGSAASGLPADRVIGELTIDEREQLCTWVATISVEKEGEPPGDTDAGVAPVEGDSGLKDSGSQVVDGGTADSGIGMTDRGVEVGDEGGIGGNTSESVEQMREKRKKAIYDDCMASPMMSACEVSEVEACFESGDSESAACKRFFECTEGTSPPTNACTDWMCVDDVWEWECIAAWGQCGRGQEQCKGTFWEKDPYTNCVQCKLFWDDEHRPTGEYVEQRNVRCYEWFVGCKTISWGSTLDVVKKCRALGYPRKYYDGQICTVRDVFASRVSPANTSTDCDPDSQF